MLIFPIAGVLAEIGRLLESEQRSEARIHRVLELLNQVVPYDSCMLLAGSSKGAPLFCIPQVSESRRRALRLWLVGVLHLMEGDEIEPSGGETNRLVLPVIAGDQIIGILKVERATRYELHHVQLLSAAASQLGAFLAMVELVTERNRVEESLRTSESRLRAMLRQAAVGIVLTDREGRFLEVNQRFCQIVEQPAEKLLAADCQSLAHADDLPLYEVMLAELLAEKRSEFALEQRYSRNDGSWVWVNVTVTPMRDGNNRIRRLLAIVQDVDARRRVEEALREQEKRLRKTEKIVAAGRLAASLAHEINNPLSSVTNVLYLLGSHPGIDDSALGLVTTGAAELARVSRIVKQALSYYREGSIPQDVDIGILVQESLGIYDARFRQAGVEVRRRVERGTWLYGFQDEVRQVIDNLVLNAVESISSGGRITVSVRASVDWADRTHRGVRLTVADTGCGIPKNAYSKLFEPFFSTKAEKGSGLGMWITRSILAKHDGKIRLRSSVAKPRNGTVISIFWPFHSRNQASPK